MEIPSNGSTNGAEFVSGLMQRLKSGEISKMQLFQQLATLQPGSPAPIPSPPTHASAFSSAPPSLPDQAGMTNQPSFSTPFSVLRQASSSGLSGNGNYNREDFSNAYGQSLSRQSSNYVPVSEVRDTDFLDGGISHEKAQRLSVQEWMANKNTTSSHQSITSMAHSSSNSPTHRGSVASQVNTILRDHYTPRGSLFFQNQESSDVVSSAYTNHYQQQYEVYQQQQEQLNHPVHHPRELMIEEYDSKNGVQNSRVENFTPTNGDPNGNENKFHERVARWKSQKEIMREQMKQQMLQEELSECTFHPRINPKSNKVAAKLRGKNTNQNVTERLYQEADNYKAREELAAKLKAEEDAEIERECTFKPRINKNGPIAEKAKSKYLEIPQEKAILFPSSSSSSSTPPPPSTIKELEECTFKPKVNPLSPSMASAQLYVKQSIFERLSRPCSSMIQNDNKQKKKKKEEEEEEEEDILCFSSSSSSSFSYKKKHTNIMSQDDLIVGKNKKKYQAHERQRRPHSAGNDKKKEDCFEHDSSNDNSNDSNKKTPKKKIKDQETKLEKAKQFQFFLQRQKFYQEIRKKNLENVKQQISCVYRPMINKKSLELMLANHGKKGNFLERLHKYQLQKKHQFFKKNANNNNNNKNNKNQNNKTIHSIQLIDPQCTFKPQINPLSSKRKARSVIELSRGDLLRKETTQRLMKLKMEQEEMSRLTFCPQLNRISKKSEGKLKILSNPETYLQRIQLQTQVSALKQRRAIQEKEFEEFAECTFKPHTIESPAYVQRIARSVLMTKEIQKAEKAKKLATTKPEWK